MSVRREDVLGALQARGMIEKPVTTLDVAAWLGVEEYAVRGAMSWLCISRVIEVAGSVRRTDEAGRPYTACVYHWYGDTIIPKVSRNRDARAPAEVWDVGCFNLLISAISRTKRRVV